MTAFPHRKLQIDKYVYFTYILRRHGLLTSKPVVTLSKVAEKQLRKVPNQIRIKFSYWCDLIQTIGLRESRRYKGFHDEPLQGDRFGQRSVRLSKAYRAIYRVILSEKIELIEVLEVNKHDY